MARPLEGIRVLDLTTALGEAAGRILADLGAEVIKVEPMPGGDKTRNLSGGGSGFFSDTTNTLVDPSSFTLQFTFTPGV